MIIEKQYLDNRKLAGFWTRIMAQNIDVLFSIFVFFIFYVIGLDTSLTIYLGAFFTLCYYIGFEASSFQATPGKMIIGIVVTTNNFEKITVTQSVIRTLGKILSLSVLFVGFSMIEFNKRRKGLHDFIANTQVIFKEKGQ